MNLTDKQKDWFLLLLAGFMIIFAIQDYLTSLNTLWLLGGGIVLALYAMGVFHPYIQKLKRRLR